VRFRVWKEWDARPCSTSEEADSPLLAAEMFVVRMCRPVDRMFEPVRVRVEDEMGNSDVYEVAPSRIELKAKRVT